MSQKSRKGQKSKASQPSSSATIATTVKEERMETVPEFDITCKDFLSIQNDLNLDDDTAEEAYKSFLKVSNEYTLSEPVTDWYACAIYTSCRKNKSNNANNSKNGNANNSKGKDNGRDSAANNAISISDGQTSPNEGNFVSQTRILRSCNISVIRFCKKMAHWSDMVNFDPGMRKKLNQLEGSFNVTTAIFKKYKTIFEEIFKCPSAVMPSRFCGKNRKNIKKQALASNDIYHFCWTFFVYIKSKLTRIRDNLLDSYHLMLVCIDYCFCAVLTCDNALDIINTSFYESLAKSYGKDPKQYQMDNPSASKICILDLLCDKFTGKVVEAKEIKLRWVPKLIKDMLKAKTIKKKENGYSIIDTDVIDFNFRFFKQNYETHVLSGGDFDECVYLNDNASRELGTEELQSIDINDAVANSSQKSGHDNPYHLLARTPLTSGQYGHQNGTSVPMTPITSATQSVSRLQSILQGQKPMASERLQFWLMKFRQDVHKKDEDKDNEDKNQDKNEDKDKDENKEEDKKVKLLDHINGLLKRMGDIFVKKYDQDDDYQEVVIRDTELLRYVLTGHMENRRDTAISLFYYILEKMFFREVDKYSRKQVPESEFLPQLKRIFERNLFIQALFVVSLEIVVFTYKLRKFPMVLEIFNDEPDLKMHPFYICKIIEPIIREEPNMPRGLVNHLASIEEKIHSSLAWDSPSPIWIWLSGRKGKAPTCQEVCLNISVNNSNPPTPIKPELGTVLLTPKKFTLPNNSGLNSVNSPLNTAVSSSKSNMEPPTKTVVGGAARGANMQAYELFFRKVYLLASVRLMNICDRLSIKMEELRKLIWTCLENAISQHTELLADRNLDQLIMCAVYSVNAINKSSTGSDIKFQDIINVYQQQPQAEKMIYKSVLLTNRNLIENNNHVENVASAEEKRGTIIDFYNKVFLAQIGNEFILKLSLKKNGTGLSQSLGEINRMVNSHRDNDAANTMLMINNHNSNSMNSAAVKRKIFKGDKEDKEEESEPPNKLPFLKRRIQSMFNERQILSASSSANASPTEDSNDSGNALLSQTTSVTVSQQSTQNAQMSNGNGNSGERLAPPPILSSLPIVAMNNS